MVTGALRASHHEGTELRCKRFAHDIRYRMTRSPSDPDPAPRGRPKLQLQYARNLRHHAILKHGNVFDVLVEGSKLPLRRSVHQVGSQMELPGNTLQAPSVQS